MACLLFVSDDAQQQTPSTPETSSSNSTRIGSHFFSLSFFVGNSSNSNIIVRQFMTNAKNFVPHNLYAPKHCCCQTQTAFAGEKIYIFLFLFFVSAGSALALDQHFCCRRRFILIVQLTVCCRDARVYCVFWVGDTIRH